MENENVGDASSSGGDGDGDWIGKRRTGDGGGDQMRNR